MSWGVYVPGGKCPLPLGTLFFSVLNSLIHMTTMLRVGSL